MKERILRPSHLILAMALAGFFSGIALVGIYLLTLPRINRNRTEALEKAIYKVLPDASAYEKFVPEGDHLAPLEEAGKVLDDEVVYRGLGKAGNPVGFAIPAEGPGFMDTIKVLYGFDPLDEKITGLEVLESRETPGLGDKIISDPHFHENFLALKVLPEIKPVKNGKKTKPNEVDCISGATISSTAVVKLLNKSVPRWLSLFSHSEERAVEKP